MPKVSGVWLGVRKGKMISLNIREVDDPYQIPIPVLHVVSCQRNHAKSLELG
jgi:hypothetical protein